MKTRSSKARSKQPKKRNKGKHKSGLAKKADRYSNRLRSFQTKAEKYFGNLLKQVKIPYQSQKIVMIPGSTFFIIDFYVKDRNLCIELDGGYHLEPEQIAKDISKDTFLKGKGYRVWRMTNEQAEALTPETALTEIANYPVTKVGNIRILPPAEAPTQGPLWKKEVQIKKRRGIRNPRPMKHGLHLDALLAHKRKMGR